MREAGFDELIMSVRTRGGIVRSAELVRRGQTHRRIADAVALGLLVRLRRVWVALPDADPLLVAAAREGVVVACVTAAERDGAWVLDKPVVPHVAASAHRGHAHVDPRKARVHRARPVLARDPAALVDPVENVLDLVARCQPREHALTIVESTLRTGKVTRPALERLPISAALRTLLQVASPELMLLGYHVIRVGYAQVIDDWPWVQDLIMRAVAQGLHLAR